MRLSIAELERCTPMQRAAYHLHGDGETTLAQVDAKIGATSGAAAKMRLYRMRQKLGIPAPRRLPGRKRIIRLAQQPA